MKKPGKLKVSPSGKTKDLFVGRFFHSFDIEENPDGVARREIGWQGIVLEKRLRGNYLILLSDWLSGGPSDQLLVHRDEMTDWQFYDSDAEMRKFYEDRMSKVHGSAPR